LILLLLLNIMEDNSQSKSEPIIDPLRLMKESGGLSQMQHIESKDLESDDDMTEDQIV
jgi:hypothetical protein